MGRRTRNNTADEVRLPRGLGATGSGEPLMESWGWRCSAGGRLVAGAAGHRWKAVSRHPLESRRRRGRHCCRQLFLRRVVLLAKRHFLHEERDYYRSSKNKNGEQERVGDRGGK